MSRAITIAAGKPNTDDTVRTTLGRYLTRQQGPAGLVVRIELRVAVYTVGTKFIGSKVTELLDRAVAGIGVFAPTVRDTPTILHNAGRIITNNDSSLRTYITQLPPGQSRINLLEVIIATAEELFTCVNQLYPSLKPKVFVRMGAVSWRHDALNGLRASIETVTPEVLSHEKTGKPKFKNRRTRGDPI